MKMIPSARALAKLLKLSGQAVARHWLKHPDWPFGPAPWKADLLPKIKAWGLLNLSPDRSKPAADPPIPHDATLAEAMAKLPIVRRIEVGAKLSRTQRDQFQLSILKKKFHSIAECELNQVRIHREVVKAFQGLAARQPGATGEQRKWLDSELERICNKLAAGPASKSPAV